jgi:glutamate carboxypeptidase
VVRRKGAATLRVRATGRASHSGTAPQKGVNALLAVSDLALALAAQSDPDGPDRLTVTPTVIRSGDAFNVVPAAGELVLDLRAADTDAFAPVLATIPAQIRGAQLEPQMERVWPAMDTEAATAPLLAAAAARLGRPLVPRSRGGASDASHFAPSIPLTVDGLGPCGRGAHTPGEFIYLDSLRDRAEIALAVALAALA